MTNGDTPNVYRGMSQRTLNAAYDNLDAVEDSQQWIAGWVDRSQAIRGQADAISDIRYGGAQRALLDYFRCGATRAPLLVFFHGGYWLRNHKDMFAFIAEGPLARGFDVAVPGYTLAPDASLSQIVAEAGAAIAFLAQSSERLCFDTERMITSGWSAGGHLAATLMHDPHVSAVLGISGIYDLEPIAWCDINDTLGLSSEEVQCLSPVSMLSARATHLAVVYGGYELPELQRQSRDFTRAATSNGIAAHLAQIDGHHHFSILDELSSPNGRITQLLSSLVLGL